MTRALCLVGGFSLLMTAAASRADSPQPMPCTAWPAVDALGRTLPLPDEVGPPREDRFAGIFYFLWLNEVHNKSPQGPGPYDVAKILAKDPDALKDPKSPLWGPIGTSHYWGEPLYGYYLSHDPWVLRRHAHLLSDAGIDTLIFDTTNAITYRDTYLKLCEVFRQVRSEGGRTPQIAFMVNTEAGKTAARIFSELYEPGLYPELWFRWKGKPLMICDPAQANDELRAFFTLRRAHWPFEMVNTKDAWHWEAAYPQPYGFSEDPGVAEQVNVSVAQNLRAADGKVTNMSDGNARGRSFHAGEQAITKNSVLYGHNLAEQWKRAFELKAPFVMITGWNEWIAGRWGDPANGVHMFVDQYSQEFSRDIEPMKGGHGDNYYWQMVAKVRRYKGAPPLPEPSGPTTISISGGFEQWRDVGPEFRDHVGETMPRDFAGAGGLHYTNKTGRNDIEAAKVARDDRNIYFYVRTRESITPRTDSNWMWLLIDADGDARTGWEGCDFIVNRSAPEEKTALLEKNAGGWKWQPSGRIGYRCAGREVHLVIPRDLLGLSPAARKQAIHFKWADHLQSPGEVMDFYLSGDVAPDARFMYRYAWRGD